MGVSATGKVELEKTSAVKISSKKPVVDNSLKPFQKRAAPRTTSLITLTTIPWVSSKIVTGLSLKYSKPDAFR